MDITAEFRARVKAAKTLHRGRAGGGTRHQHRVPEHAELVLAAYTKQCGEIRGSIEGLRAALLESRRQYVGANELVLLGEKMSSGERAQLDAEMEQYVRDCRKAIAALPDLSDGQAYLAEDPGAAAQGQLRDADDAADGAAALYARQAAALLRSTNGFLQRVVDAHTQAVSARAARDAIQQEAAVYSFDVDLEALEREEKQEQDKDNLAAAEAASAVDPSRRASAKRTTVAAAKAASSLVTAASTVFKDGLRRRRETKPDPGPSPSRVPAAGQGGGASAAAHASVAEEGGASGMTRVVADEDEVLAGLDEGALGVLAQENSQVLERMDTFGDDVLRAESRVVELSRLQGVRVSLQRISGPLCRRRPPSHRC